MFPRVVVSGTVMIVVAGAALAAQTQNVTRLGDPAPEERQLKAAVQNFEQIVVNAVIEGGRLVQEEVRNSFPEISLRLAGEPVVSGVPISGVGYVFDVQCPDILGSQVFFLEQFLSRPELRPTGASRGSLPPDFSADRAYGNYVRDSLRGSLVDASPLLPLTDIDVLVVIARVPSGQPRQALEDSRKLILKIAGQDLRLYREGAITRDEVLARIVEQRF